MKKTMFLALLAVVFISAYARAGAMKSGGSAQILLDNVDSTGGVSTGGAGKLYSSIGQQSPPSVKTAGVYTLVGGFLSVVDETPPTIAFTSPGTSSGQSGNVGVAGTAFDMNGVRWTLYYGPGSSPVLWKQIASGIQNISGASLATWDSSGRHGVYTLKVVAVDGRGNTAVGAVVFNVSNTISISGTLPAFKWMILSLPAEPAATDPISMFGSGEYRVYRWDPEVETSSERQGKYRAPSALHSGNGFWIKAYYTDHAYSFNGSVVDTTQDFTMAVKPGWNQIGTPFDRAYPWNQVRVRYNGTEYDLGTASAMNLISTTLQGYDPAENSWTQKAPGDDLTARAGYFARVYDSVDLLFGPGAGMPGGLAKIVHDVYDYRIKLSAAAKDSADMDNYIESVSAARDDFDSLDAEEPPITPADKYTALYFPHDNWASYAGWYANDVRPSAKSVGHTEAWSFNVDTNETGQAVKISWDNARIPSTDYTFTLINIDTGERTNMAERNIYTYTAVASGGSAAENHFKIEVVKLTADLITKTYTLAPGWNLISVPVEPEAPSALAVLGKSLPQLNVYQYFDGKFYAAEKADIQSGLGYWVNVAGSTQISVEGKPAGSSITVPLKPGWNIIGNPFEASVIWGDNITLTCNNIHYTLAQAVAASMIDGKLYSYNGNDYTLASALEPWKGYLLKSKAACDMTLTH